MNAEMEAEQQQLEAELKRLRAAPAPAQLQERLITARRLAAEAKAAKPATAPPRLARWRWMVPVAGTAMLLVLVAAPRREREPAHPPVAMQSAAQSNYGVGSTSPAVMAKQTPEEMDIEHELVSTFDAIAQLPTGEPVRLQCRRWSDRMTFHDRDRGITVEKSTPRLEIIPVRFETY